MNFSKISVSLDGNVHPEVALWEIGCQPNEDDAVELSVFIWSKLD
jgi:hypothetical protein